MTGKKKREYAITIDGIQDLSGERSTMSLFTLGSYTAESDGRRVISYKESAATGFEGDTTTVTVDKDRSVIMLREGNTNSQLIIERGRRNLCHYETLYGGMSLGVSAKEIVNGLTENGGTLSFKYSLDVDANTMCENEVNITVRERN